MRPEAMTLEQILRRTIRLRQLQAEIRGQEVGGEPEEDDVKKPYWNKIGHWRATGL
jgi:hypothetical protein